MKYNVIKNVLAVIVKSEVLIDNETTLDNVGNTDFINNNIFIFKIMADQNRLIQLVKENISQGFTTAQIKTSMLDSGWQEQDIDIAILAATGKKTGYETKPNHGFSTSAFYMDLKFKLSNITPSWINIKTIAGGFGVLLILLSGYFFYPLLFPEPICGNNKLEKDETSLTCCEDAGCDGDLICENGECLAPTPACTECQYLDGKVCKSYTCCADIDCEAGDACANPSTIQSSCIELEESSFSLKVNEEGIFKVDGEPHIVKLSDINDTSAEVIITSEPIIVIISINETKQIDINNDTIKDIEINLISIKGNKADITLKNLKKIEPKPTPQQTITGMKCSKHVQCDDGNVLTKDICSFEAGSRFGICQNWGEGDIQNECEEDSECDDELDLTNDVCFGIPKTCHFLDITECENGDGFCAYGCSYEADSDCPETNTTATNSTA